MPTLLNNAVGLKGTSGTSTYFITLNGAQPNLGQTPTTSTGYTLVTGSNGQLQFTNTLGGVAFTSSTIQTSVPNGNLTIQSTGTGALNLNGNVYINGQTLNAGTGTFSSLTVTNLTAQVGYINGITATTIITNYLQVNTETVFNKLSVTGGVTLSPNNGQDVTIEPTNGGTVYIQPGRTGYLDNLIIGSNSSASGFFTNVTANTLSLSSPLNVTTATFVNLTVTNTATINNLFANTVSTDQIFLNSNNISLGNGAAADGQQQDGAIAIGYNAGASTQTIYAIAIGYNAGQTGQQGAGVAIGFNAGVSLQGNSAIAIGQSSGEYNQGGSAVAIGSGAGQTNQNGIAIGYAAGSLNQNLGTVAIGYNAAANTQSYYAVAIGPSAGQNIQGNSAVAIGLNAGQNTQGSNAIAIGFNAGQNTQSGSAVALGYLAGQNSQLQQTIAIGSYAGQNSQSYWATALGYSAGQNSQGNGTVAVGFNAGQNTQTTYAIALGWQAGQYKQGSRSIAIGALAGQYNQPNNSIIIDATGILSTITNASAFYVAPIRNDASSSATSWSVYYNPITKEVTTAASFVAAITSGTDISISTTGTGTLVISDTSTLQSVTNRGATTTNVIYLTNTATSTSTTTGALQVAGGIGVASGLFIGGTSSTFVGSVGIGSAAWNSAFALSVSGGVYLNVGGNSFTIQSTTAPLQIGSLQTTGVITFGGVASTGAINIGQSTASQPINIANGLTSVGNTKTVNIATGGLTSSTTVVNIGTTATGSTSTIIVNGQHILNPGNISSPAWTTSGIALIQNTATYTDLTSSGTVTQININTVGAATVSATNTVTLTYLVGTYFAAPVAGNNISVQSNSKYAVYADTLYAGYATLPSVGTFIQGSTSFTINGTNAGTHTLGGTLSSGVLNIAGSNQSIGPVGTTKTVNIGNNGTYTTLVTIGSNSGTTSTIIVNGQNILNPGNISLAAWGTNGVGLIQNAGTFTDLTTTASNTVTNAYMNLFNTQTYAAANTTVTVSNLYGTYFNAPVAGTNVTAPNRYAIGADSLFLAGTMYAPNSSVNIGQLSGGLTVGTLNQSGWQFNINGNANGACTIGSSLGAGSLAIGSNAGTGLITLGFSTLTQTLNLASGATAAGSTKTVNIGTSGLTSSTTVVNIGTTATGSTSTIIVNGQHILNPGNNSVPAWGTSGVAFVQTAGTFTDLTTTASTTVTTAYMNLFAPQTYAAANTTVTVTTLYGTYFQNPIRGKNVSGGTTYALAADSINAIGNLTAGGAITGVASGSSIGIFSNTGNAGIGTGLTVAGNTKTVNIATGGLTSSTTVVNIGTAASTSTVAILGVVSATSTITGALTVAGGVGIGGNLYVGGTFYAGGQAVLTTSSFASSISGGTDIQIVTSSSGTLIFNDTSTLQTVTSRGSTTNNAVQITNTSSSTSTTTGALQVSGGVGIGGNLNVGGTLTINNAMTVVNSPYIFVDAGPVAVDSFPTSTYRAAKYFISISNAGNNQYQASEIWLIQDGAAASIEQTSVFSNGANIVTFSATVVSNVVTLYATGANAGNSIKMQSTYMTA